MADLGIKESSQTVSITGVNSSGVETNFVGSSANGELLSVDGLSEGGVEGNLNLVTGGTVYEAKVGGSKLPNRKLLIVTALDDMYWGLTNSVTTSTGTPLKKDQTAVFDINPNSTFSVYLVASANNKNARIVESP